MLRKRKIALAAPCLTFFFLSCNGSHVGQPSTHGWQGEWGQFALANSERPVMWEGERLLVADCGNEGCQAKLQINAARGEHCGGSGVLKFQNESSGTIHLKPVFESNEPECILTAQLTGQGAERHIEVKTQSGNCSYFCTPNCRFDREFPFHSKQEFYGDHIEQCYATKSKAMLALCTHSDLAALEKQWEELSWSVDDLQAKSGQPDAISQTEGALEQRVQQCDGNADPAKCLTDFFHTDMSSLNVKKTQWLAEVTEPGDPKAARKQIAALAGTYVHNFSNGDVAGEKYTSTNRLTISPASNDSIHFSTHLEFFNGHQCEASGVAQYKRNGSFIYQARNYENKLCVLEIVPGTNGVAFADPTGICTLSYCGARGSFRGITFPLSDRTPKTAATK